VPPERANGNACRGIEVIKERVARLVAASDKEPAPDFLQFITPDIQARPIPNLADRAAQERLESSAS